MKQLLIIIITGNFNNLINNCLYGVFHYNDIEQDLEVIIIDNRSENVSVQMHSLIYD